MFKRRGKAKNDANKRKLAPSTVQLLSTSDGPNAVNLKDNTLLTSDKLTPTDGDVETKLAQFREKIDMKIRELEKSKAEETLREE